MISVEVLISSARCPIWVASKARKERLQGRQPLFGKESLVDFEILVQAHISIRSTPCSIEMINREKQRGSARDSHPAQEVRPGTRLQCWIHPLGSISRRTESDTRGRAEHGCHKEEVLAPSPRARSELAEPREVSARASPG